MCPHCDRPLGRRAVLGTPLKTCGSHECHHLAIAAGIRATWAKKPPAPVHAPTLGQYPWRSKEIDFQNGFASQNIVFAADWLRIAR